MLTAEDLRAIAERHAKTEAAPWPIDAIEGTEAHADRAALLSFVRALIEPFPDGRPPMYDHLCQWCGAGDAKVDHDADCPYVAAQGVKP